jgi:hypothetical protein
MTLKAAQQKLLGKTEPAKQQEPPEPPKGRPHPPTHPDDDDPEGPLQGDAASYYAERDWEEPEKRNRGATDGSVGTTSDTGRKDDSDRDGAVTSPEPPDEDAPKDRPAGGTDSATADLQPAPTSDETPPVSPRVAMLTTFRDDPGTLPKQFQKKLISQFVAWLLES